MRASRLHRFGRVGPAQLIGASGMRSPGSSLANATPDQGERVTEVIGGVAASEHGSDRTLGLGWAMAEPKIITASLSISGFRGTWHLAALARASVGLAFGMEQRAATFDRLARSGPIEAQY